MGLNEALDKGAALLAILIVIIGGVLWHWNDDINKTGK